MKRVVTKIRLSSKKSDIENRNMDKQYSRDLLAATDIARRELASRGIFLTDDDVFGFVS
jgi:hypothetical protein